ncbi:biopolymer transporter ExbD [Phaeobacter sp. B1627]|uniref:ExbD/TolR family protein n=1 Tax=Phaeobacter sp. B1627 TaxID=2583809 RepID=UPI001119F8EF|nr:biopolymer transporter ExbD [Phaeobacter sp. B1627]TNJ47479.1 biopolymer transporter ExbD [Phaeobacter sp. B1627]
MDLTDAPRRPRAESIVPMINVVFLLLIFFLMTSRLAQPDPFEITPPTADLDAPVEAEATLYVDKTGRLSFDGVEGDAALARLAQVSASDAVLQLRADSALEAAKAAALLKDLSAAGFARVELVVSPK